ncbi:hypothetical protein M422DRAFT_258663 [Sphaerobolus stellatus SS14]|uniref:Uncharacterized protein n=1 Tax=Sphaerobolus stellatus (strain SS14) TaxID=990650 RepID=A0A0C9VAG5_SPHS4|nr:hypothetical protein M422DRAFT_258663 [Sphaerobolus stellatus SS14]
MTDLQLPAHMLAWKASSEVVCMEEIPAGDPRRTVRGFEADKKFDGPVPKFSFNDPYEEEGDRLSKERTQRESCFRELLDTEMAASAWKRAEEMARALETSKEKARLEKEKGKEKEREVEKEKEAGRPVVPRPQPVVQSESKEDEDTDDDKLQSCISCVKKKILCVPQAGKKVCVTCEWCKMKCEFFDKTTWAVMDGSKQIAESMRELVGLERCREAGRLEVVWHDHQRFMMEIEQRSAADSAAADARMLQLLELKDKGVDILAELEKRIRAKCDLVQDTFKEQIDDLTERMDNILKRTALTKNGLPRLNQEVPPAATQGTKRKGDNEGNCAEGSKKKEKKKVVETEEEDSTMR